MAISQLPPSKESKPTPYRACSKLKQRKPSEFKKKPFQKRPAGSQHNPINEEEIDDTQKPIACYKKGAHQLNHSLGFPKQECSAVDRAHEVQARLPHNFPSFAKLMLKSHVTGGFWLGLPRRFCHTHMPNSDVSVSLVDESEEEHYTKYLWQKNGLSAGWRGFSMAHNLVEGDVLVFQLIMPCRFKVYIVRVHGSAEIDGALGLLNLDFQAKPLSSANASIKDKDEDENLENADASEHSSSSANIGDDDSEGIRFSDTVVELKEVKSSENFSIVVDGLVIDAEIPVHLRAKYYQLCCSQSAYLHSHIFKGLNCKLIAGVIVETVNISDAIRAVKITTPLDYLQLWDRTLKSFEDMGMKVGFLRARIEKMISFQSEREEMIQMKRNERARLEEDMRNLKDAMDGLDEEIKMLKAQNGRPEVAFKEMANAPW